MAECPGFIPRNLCELTQYIPIQELGGQQIASFLFGVLVVVVFSIDHYKVPTYAKTTIGEFIELAPESLTSHSRYMKGLGIYIALMLGFYGVLLVIGPTAIAPILSFLSAGAPGVKIDSAIWPLAATSIITLIGSRSDDKYLGRMEGWLRSIAHEAAYIPYSVTNLSSALEGSFPLKEDELRAAGELTPATQSLIQESQEGFRQNWIRAKYLYSRLDQLRGDEQFRPLMRLPENERAFSFVEEQKVILSKEMDRSSEPDEALAKKVNAFKSALAVFLASILWRGCNTESAVNAKLIALRLNVNAPTPLSLATFIFHLFVYLGGIVLLWAVVFQVRQMQFQDASIAQKWHLTLAFLVFLLTAFFVTRWREKQLGAGEWKYTFDAALRCAVFCALAIGGVSVVVTFALQQGGVWSFYGMLLAGFSMALLSALLFQVLMRWAATSPPTNEAVASGLAYATAPLELIKVTARAGALYAVVAFVAVFGLLYWIPQFWIVWGSPQQIIDYANDNIAEIRALHKGNKEEDQWFIKFVSREAIDDLADALNAAKFDLSSYKIKAATIPAILARCDDLGKLEADKQIFKSGCERDPYIKKLDWKGEVLPRVSDLQFQISALPQRFDALKKYQNIQTALKSDWGNALLTSLIWAVMAAVFAVSVLLYRRQVLWEGLKSKKMPDFVPRDLAERQAWLRQPLYDIGKLSPLEALLYPAFRARLADHINTRAEPPEAPKLQVVA